MTGNWRRRYREDLSRRKDAGFEMQEGLEALNCQSPEDVSGPLARLIQGLDRYFVEMS